MVEWLADGLPYGDGKQPLDSTNACPKKHTKDPIGVFCCRAAQRNGEQRLYAGRPASASHIRTATSHIAQRTPGAQTCGVTRKQKRNAHGYVSKGSRASHPSILASW